MSDNTHPLGNRKLAQIAMVVRDIEEAKLRYATILGLEVPPTIVTDPGSAVNMTYRGEPSDDKAKLAFFDLGGVQLELIEPIGKNSAWYEGLERNGESVHHIAFSVVDMDAATKHLGQHGIDLIHRGDMGKGQYVYFDAQAKLGTMLELLQHG